MNKNLDLIAKDLYAKIFNYPNLVMQDVDGNDIDVDQVEGARKFNFDYEIRNRNLANVTIDLNDRSENQDSLEVLISNDPVDSHDDYAKKMFLKFGKEMREFAKQHLLTFNIHVATRSTKERDIGESIMSESKLYGTAKTSYQRIGEAILVIKHRDVVNQANPAGRAQRIESIYVENSQGERFKYPFRHLNGARAMAQHVAHGGNPYDNIGQHMVGLSEELNKLRMFKNYVGRNDAISEAMGSINEKVLERIDQVKREIQHLQRPTSYREFAENFIEHAHVEIPEDVMNDWIDRLTVRSFNEELKNVFPYIFKLVSESDIPVKELSVEDLVSKDNKDISGSAKSQGDLPEMSEYTSYLTKLTESGETGIFSPDNTDAIAELNQLLENPLLLGVDGTNAVQSLTGLGFDDDFLDGLKEMAKTEAGANMDARPFVKEYVQQKDATLGTEVLSQLSFNEESVEEPAPEPELTSLPAEDQPEETPPAGPPAAAPVAEALMKEENRRMFNELKEFIYSMYNEDQGNFPKGVEGVKIACEKKFGDRVGPIAAKIVERMTSMGEMARMKKLSGLSEGPFSGAGKIMMKHKLKKGIKKDQDDTDNAFDNMHDYDFDDELRFGHEDDFAKAFDAKRRKEKALNRLSRKISDDDIMTKYVIPALEKHLGDDSAFDKLNRRGEAMIEKYVIPALEKAIGAGSTFDRVNAYAEKLIGKYVIPFLYKIMGEEAYDSLSPKSAAYILRKIENGTGIDELISDFPELTSMIRYIANDRGLDPVNDSSRIKKYLINDLMDIVSQESDDEYDDVREGTDELSSILKIAGIR